MAPPQVSVQLHANTDGISQVRFSSRMRLDILATSWDGGVTLYDSTSGGQLARAESSSPVLCCAFDGRSSMAFCGGVDRVVNAWDVEAGKALEAIGTHENTIRCMEWCAATNSLVTGGWDSAVRLWDARASQQTAQVTIRASSRVFAMDVHETHVAIGQQDGSVRIYDVKKPDTPLVDRQSSLGHQIRCMRFFDKGQGLASGSIEGRVAIENTDPSVTVKRYTFKCHRAALDNKIYPVNCLAFNPAAKDIFATGGADGSVCVWDQAAKKRVYALEGFATSVAACEFSLDGSLLVVAVSYTFERGNTEHPKDQLLVFSHEREMRDAT